MERANLRWCRDHAVKAPERRKSPALLLARAAMGIVIGGCGGMEGTKGGAHFSVTVGSWRSTEKGLRGTAVRAGQDNEQCCSNHDCGDRS